MLMNFFKRRAAAPGDDLRYEDIPNKQDRAVEAETYPQKSRPIPALPMHDIVDRYSGLLRSILDNLPLTADEINRMIMPVISRLIRLVHLLPASEAQHHSGCGGLLVHSLESAAIGLLYASNEVFDQGRTPEHRYRNQPRWICAAAVLLLIHDVGKVCAVVVTDSDGNLWNPEAQPLLDWLRSTGAKQFFVDWKPEREHKEHERRSVRFAYRYLLTEDLVHYLTAVSDGELLNAIDDALMLGSGTLSGILKLADGRSVAQDNARRKRISGDFTYVSSPLVNPIIEAMRQNIASGRWKVNTSGGTVFVSPQGVFIRAEQDMGRSIRETAVSQGFSSIPVAFDRIANVLADSGFVEVFEPTGEVFCTVRRADGTSCTCIHFLDPARLFPAGAPASESVEVSAGIVQEPDTSSKKPSVESLMPGDTDYRALAREPLEKAPSPSSTGGNDAGHQETGAPHLSKREKAEVLKTPLDKSQRKPFSIRLLNEVLAQMRSGGGDITPDCRRDGEARICSSLNAERIAENHGIATSAFEAFFAVIKLDPDLSLDIQRHLFILKEKS